MEKIGKKITEKVAQWCIKRKINAGYLFLICVGIFAACGLIIECFNLSGIKHEMAIYLIGAMAVLTIIAGIFLLDVGELIDKIKKREEK